MGFQMIITGICLIICTYTDLRYRCIYRRVVFGIMILSAAGHAVSWFSDNAAFWSAGQQDLAEISMSAVTAASGLIPGMICFLISFLTREAFGYGDSVVVTACGISLGLEKTAELLVMSFFLSALWAVFLCIFRKAGLKKEFPFLPFLSAAFVLQIITGLSMS